MNIVSSIFDKEIKRLEREYFRDNLYSDTWRLNYHLMPPIGWLNDPNGLSYFRGNYNIFFQYSPFNVDGGLKFWGHYQTKDFINYKFLSVSIFPDSRYDCHGVYSGSALIENDILYLYYTGNVKLDGDYDYINSGRESNTIFISSSDAVNFSKKKCVIEMENYPSGITNHIRDPKVWKSDNMYYMIQGVRKDTKPNNIGSAFIFKSNDKLNWKYLSSIDSFNEFGYMWECPDLFNINGQDILIVCPQGVENIESKYENLYLSGYFLLNEDYKKGNCTVDNFTVLDNGFDFYAPQTFLDENNDRIMIAWMGLPDIDNYYKNLTSTWQHCLTIPRKLEFRNNKLYQIPYNKLEILRKSQIDIESIAKNNISSYEGIIKVHNSNNFSILISNGLLAKYENNRFILEFLDDNLGALRKIRKSYLSDLYNIRFFVDCSSVEIFINDGELVFSSRFYPNKHSLQITGNYDITLYELSCFNIEYNF